MKEFFKFLFILSLTLLLANKSYSTHVRAGEITYRLIKDLKYEIILETYTNTEGAVDRNEVEIFFGDKSSAIVKRTEKLFIDNKIIYNKYVTTHSYSGTGEFIIGHFDRNRMVDIENMEDPGSTPFYCETLLTISGIQGKNRSPILEHRPIDFAQVGTIYFHNPGASDPDGDSLVFSLITPKQNSTSDVKGYFLPDHGDGFTLDPYTGQLVWNVPDYTLIYNIAILIEEFRMGDRIGYVIRDMQIIVKPGNNNPPVINPVPDTCILAGSNFSLSFVVDAYDIDSGQSITLTATGGPFKQANNKATIFPDPAINVNTVSTIFNWQPSCDHIRKNPWQVVFYAEDNHQMIAQTVSWPFFIQVVGPAPQNLSINSTIRGIELNWDPPTCIPVGYNIYRRMDSSFWDTSTCEVGIPSSTDFVFLDSMFYPVNTTYFDDNKGNGLSAGIVYCYRITAIYQNKVENHEPVEGYASTEVCAMQQKELPIMTHVTVLETDKTKGKILLAWANPVDLDTFLYKGPYKYDILRKKTGSSFTLLKSIYANQLHELTDTSLTDTLLDTENEQYIYKIEFYCTDTGYYLKLGQTPTSKSIFLDIESTHETLILKWNVNVPWRNDTFVIYSKNDATGQFDSIGYSLAKSYTDPGLENGKTYCYRIKSIGGYSKSANLIHPIINYSQENCAFPRDTIPPCPPVLSAKSLCSYPPHSELDWQYQGDTSCAWDVIGYRIYYSPMKEDNFVLVTEIDSYTNWFYWDERIVLEYNLAGCYKITAVDSYNNESMFSNQVCVDNCPTYELPNVFTPNGDAFNEVFEPKEGWRYVREINLRIYNRWGQLVYQTLDPKINWDGKDFESKEDCSQGTYYYICTIYEFLLEGNKPRNIKGTITLIR